MSYDIHFHEDSYYEFISNNKIVKEEETVTTSTKTTIDESVDDKLGHSFGYAFVKAILKDPTPNTESQKHHIVASMRIERYYSSIKEELSEISPAALELLATQDYAGFFKSCGTNYVRGINRAQEVISVLSFQSLSKDQSTALADAVSGSGQDDDPSLKPLIQNMKINIKGYGLGLGAEGSEALLATTLAEFREVMKFAFRSMTTTKDAVHYGMIYGMEVIPWANNVKFQVAAGLQDAPIEVPLARSLIPTAYLISDPDSDTQFNPNLHQRQDFKCSASTYVMDKLGYCCESGELYNFEQNIYDASNPESRVCTPVRVVDTIMARENLMTNGEFVARLGKALRYKTDQLSLMTQCTSAVRSIPERHDFTLVKAQGDHRGTSSDLMYTVFDLKVALDPFGDYGIVKQMSKELDEYVEMFYTPCLSALYGIGQKQLSSIDASYFFLAYPWHSHNACTKLACLGNGMRWDRNVGGCVPGLMAGASAGNYTTDTSETLCQKDMNNQSGETETCKHNSAELAAYQQKVQKCLKGHPSIGRVDYFLEHYCLPQLSDKKLNDRAAYEIKHNYEKYCTDNTENTLNVALKKPASQSSVYIENGFHHSASLAVDGNKDGRIWRKSMAITRQDTNAWWSVDLLGDYVIKEIVLYNRQDCCQSRLADFKVQLLDDGIVTWETTFAGAMGEKETMKVDNDKIGDQVKIVLDGKTEFLQLAEVEVYNKFYSS